MLFSTIILGIISMSLIGLSYYKGNGFENESIKSALILTAQIVPLLIFAFIAANIIQNLIPKELITKWVGHESGARGIFIGALAGGLCPGGPFVSLPIAVGLIKTGASIGTMVAFLTGWSLWAVSRIPMELGILGWRLTVVRFVSTFFFPIIAGFIAEIFFKGVKIR